MPPPPIPPTISTFHPSNQFPFSFQPSTMNAYYDTIYMFPTTSDSLGSNKTSSNQKNIERFGLGNLTFKDGKVIEITPVFVF